MQNYKICPHCGEVLRPGALTCTYCKQKVNNVNPFVDIFEVNKAEKPSAQNKNAKKSSGASPVKSIKKPAQAKQSGKNRFAGGITRADKATQAAKIAASQKSDIRDRIQRTNVDPGPNGHRNQTWIPESVKSWEAKLTKEGGIAQDPSRLAEPDASWQNSPNHAWSDNEKKAWEAKKNNTQTKVYGKQRTAAPKPANSTGRNSGKSNTKSPKKKKRIIALVIIFIILTEIPWSSLGRSFYRFEFFLKQQAEHLQQMFGQEDSADKSRGNSSDDTASGTDTDSVFVLKPDSVYENGYNLSSVQISAPDGYNLSWMADDQSLLWINAKPYDSYDSLDLYGEAYLMPNTDEMKEYCKTYYDYLQNDDEYTNVVITKDQQCMTNAGTVSYVTAGYSYTTGDSEQNYNNCLCWLEYDDNTLLVLDLMHNEIDKNLPDIIQEIFAGVEIPGNTL